MNILRKLVGYPTRAKYWSCTAFADWLRGTSKPAAETGEGWRKWHKTAISSHKIRYWLAEEALDAVQNVVHFPIDVLHNIKYYINNRWVTSTHALTAHPRDIPRGEWRDVGNRFLPCLMNELVDFVEVETAWSNVAWSKEARQKYNPPFYAWGWFRWRTWRCPQAGIEHLKWAMTLTNEEWLEDGKKHEAEPTGQARAAKEIFELYTWWKEVYPLRVDPHELSGWTAWCGRRREKIKEEDEDVRFGAMLSSDNDTPEEKEETLRLLERCREIERQYEDEDEAMMIRLIKIRAHLWT